MIYFNIINNYPIKQQSKQTNQLYDTIKWTHLKQKQITKSLKTRPKSHTNRNTTYLSELTHKIRNGPITQYHPAFDPYKSHGFASNFPNLPTKNPPPKQRHFDIKHFTYLPFRHFSKANKRYLLSTRTWKTRVLYTCSGRRKLVINRIKILPW